MNLDTLLAEAKALIQSFTPIHWAIISGVLLLLILLPVINSARRRRRRRKFAPQLVLEAFQISPLGRDAFLKLRNNGEPATLTSISVRGRRDITFKSAFAGHIIEKGKTYSLLMEATLQAKLSANFSVELIYFDQRRNVYRQTFDLGAGVGRTPKLVQAGGY